MWIPLKRIIYYFIIHESMGDHAISTHHPAVSCLAPHWLHWTNTVFNTRIEHHHYLKLNIFVPKQHVLLKMNKQIEESRHLAHWQYYGSSSRMRIPNRTGAWAAKSLYYTILCIKFLQYDYRVCRNGSEVGPDVPTRCWGFGNRQSGLLYSQSSFNIGNLQSDSIRACCGSQHCFSVGNSKSDIPE